MNWDLLVIMYLFHVSMLLIPGSVFAIRHLSKPRKGKSEFPQRISQEHPDERKAA